MVFRYVPTISCPESPDVPLLLDDNRWTEMRPVDLAVGCKVKLLMNMATLSKNARGVVESFVSVGSEKLPLGKFRIKTVAGAVTTRRVVLRPVTRYVEVEGCVETYMKWLSNVMNDSIQKSLCTD